MKCDKQNAKQVSICVALSVISMICFGVRNWLLSYIASRGPEHTDVVASVWGWLGAGVLGVILWACLSPTRFKICAVPAGTSFRGYRCCAHKELTEPIIQESEVTSDTISDVTSTSEEREEPIKSKNVRFGPYGYIFPLYLGGLGSALGLISLNVGYSISPDSKGQITAVTASVSAFVALFTFLVLREKTTPGQLVGILITIGGVVMLSVEADESADFIAFAMGIVTAVLESLCNVAIGYCTKWKMDKLSNGVVLSVMIMLNFPLALIVLVCVFGDVTYGLTSTTIFGAIGAGLISTLGLITQNIAIGMWSTGTVSAITNSSAIVVMLLDWLVEDASYSALAISGVFVVILGTAVLALSPKSIERWGVNLCRKKRS